MPLERADQLPPQLCALRFGVHAREATAATRPRTYGLPRRAPPVLYGARASSRLRSGNETTGGEELVLRCNSLLRPVELDASSRP